MTPRTVTLVALSLALAALSSVACAGARAPAGPTDAGRLHVAATIYPIAFFDVYRWQTAADVRIGRYECRVDV